MEMEEKDTRFGDDEDEELTTNQIKQKAQEIAKRFEKYQGRFHNTSSSRCNTPLPITSADSIESVHSNSVISDTNEKLILFRKVLENDRKLVENSKIDGQESNNDDEANDNKLLDVQNEKERHNSTYYDDIISAQFNEKNIHLLKSQVVELNEKLRNYHNIIIEKDVLLQSKIDKIESLNKVATQKDKLHLETVEALNRRNVELYEVINEERLRSTQKINHLKEETNDLKNNLERVHGLCNELKEDNIERERIINELQKVENQLKLDIEQLIINHENEKKIFQKHNHESSRRIIDGMESELLHLHQENDSLTNRIALLESMSVNIQEKDNLLDQLKTKEALIDQLSLENKNLSDQYENQKIEVQQTENRWSQLKEAYLNDKDRMTFLEKVIEELKVNNDDLNNANVKLSEKLEISMENLTDLKTDNSKHQERINDLMAVIDNMREKFETAMKEVSIEYELDKKQLIQQHENDEIVITSCNNKLEENTLKLNKVTNTLDIVLKENYSYKNKCFELHNCINQNNKEIFELKNVITDLNNQITQMNHELKSLKNENTTNSDKLKNNLFEGEEYKTLSERYLKQKQLLRLKIKALKESENNCSNLQHQVAALAQEVDASNKKSEDLVHCNEQVNTALQYCGIEIQNCHELLNETITKSNVQNKIMRILRCVLMGLASLFDFDNSKVEFDFGLLEIFDSIFNAVPDDKELQTCLKKIAIGSINILQYIIDINNKHKLSKIELFARTEVDKLVSEAVNRVELSTQNEYDKKFNQLCILFDNVQDDNRILRLHVTSKQNKNNTLIKFLMNIREILGLVDVDEMDDEQLQYSLNELKLCVQEMKNENLLLKHQYVECQKLIASKTIEQQIDYQNLNSQNTYVQPVENVDDQKKVSLSLSSEDTCMKQPHDTEKSNVAENGDSKILLLRYKNLKSRFKEVRAKTVELDKKIISLTDDLECANSKYKQLNDQFVSANDNHETDIVNCQSEIENLMCEKLDAHRQLTTLKEKHEILQNDYDQLKSNLNDNKSVYDTETLAHANEQTTVLRRQLDDTQHLIDSAYSTVLREWPPIDTSSDWVFVQSKKLDQIVNAKCSSSDSRDNDFDAFDLVESEVQRLKTCVQTIHELVTSILTNKTTTDDGSPPAHEIIELISDLKSCTETFFESISVGNDELHSADEHRVELSHDAENHDNNVYPSVQPSSPEHPSIIRPLISTEGTINPPLSENEDTEQFQRAIAERDRLIQFLSDKISKLDNLNRSVDDIRSIREKLDRALTVVHERDVRCDELTLELTRLLEERDMLQLKLSNSIRQIQFLSENKPQMETSNLMEEKYGPRTIDDKLEELHSLEYRRDADLFVDQEHRHKSQMQLHQSHENGNSKTQREKSSNITEEANTSQSWFKDILW